MTVKELIALLQNADPDRLVVCQKDGEGNDFSPLASTWKGAYLAESTYSGEAGLETLTESDRQRGFSDLDLLPGGVPALFLVPTN